MDHSDNLVFKLMTNHIQLASVRCCPNHICTASTLFLQSPAELIYTAEDELKLWLYNIQLDNETIIRQ